MSTRSSRSRRGQDEEEPEEKTEDKVMTEVPEEKEEEAAAAKEEEKEEAAAAEEEKEEEAAAEDEKEEKPKEEEEEEPTKEDKTDEDDAATEDKTEEPKEGEEAVVKEDEDKGEATPAADEDKFVKPPKRGRKRTAAEELLDLSEPPPAPLDPEIIKQHELIENTPRTTPLEIALYETFKRKESQVERLSGEVTKLKAFISKRKQTYKRKRKDEGAPTRALSAYNIFVQDRFSRLAKENEQALKSSDTDAVLKRVPPASLVASTGNQWKELPADQKSSYEERYVTMSSFVRCVIL
jgi:hypothetical protein